ncbi:hypothetical protein Lal_00014188 [Lupinus albus]|nr:hypothetical protein Lal_00014188 [Lupinus albus]
MTVGHAHPDERREDDEHHHPRLQQGEIVRNVAADGLDRGAQGAGGARHQVAGGGLRGRAGAANGPRLRLWLVSARLVDDAGQRLELVEGRRGGQGPFQGGGTLAPRVVRSPLLRPERQDDADHEDEHTEAEDVAAVGGDLVPTGEGFRVIRVAARHAGEAEEVHREEQDVRTDEGQPEVQLAGPFRDDAAGHLREPVVDTGEDDEHGAERQHVVEVRDDVVRVVEVLIDRRVGEHHAGHAADGEEEDEAHRPVHRGGEADRTAPHGRDPGEDLHARRNRDHHGGEHEVGLRLERQADRVHVVSPHHEADDADGDHRVGHREVAEDRLARERGDDVRHDAEGRQDHDVHFGVTEEPEQVLVQDRITAAGRVEERRAEVAIGQQHRDGAREHRQRQQQEERGDQLGPGEERHLVQRHAGGAHVQDGGDEVDGAEDRARAGKVQGEDREVDGRAGMAGGRERRVDGPARACAAGAGGAFDEERAQQRAEARDGEPERDVVHARERHVRRADHQRHEPVPEAADQGGHHHEEHHDEAVAGDEDVIGRGVREVLEAGLFHLHADAEGEEGADHARAEREQQVQRADVLVVRRKEPAGEEPRHVVVVGVMGPGMGGVCCHLRRALKDGRVRCGGRARVSAPRRSSCRCRWRRTWSWPPSAIPRRPARSRRARRSACRRAAGRTVPSTGRGRCLPSQP